MQRDYATCTKGTTLHLYANASTGSDSNNGLTASTAKQTLAAVVALIPDVVITDVVVHFDGTFNESWNVKKVLHGNLIFTGSADIATVYDNGGVPFLADSSSVSSLGLSTLAMTANQYKGYWLEILDGPAAGQTRTIVAHDATTFTPCFDWSVDPGNCQFRVIKPATTVKGPSLYCSGTGVVLLNYMFVDYATTYFVSHSVGLCSVIFNRDLEFRGVHSFYATKASYNPVTGVWEAHSALTESIVPFSVLSPRSVIVAAVNSHSTVFSAGVVAELKIYSSVVNIFDQFEASSIHIDGSSLNRMLDAYGLPGIGGSYATAGSRGVRIRNAAGVGLTLVNSVGGLGDMDISDCASHAIVAKRSKLSASSVSGSGNGGAGAYLSQGTICEIGTGADVPTVTGTVGDISVDGTSQISTWAGVAAGVPVDTTTPGNTEGNVIK